VKKGKQPMDRPLLSVCLITYNHVKYIEQAIESVLSQKVNFQWEFAIADDCSNDGTTQIIRTYADKYPALIHVLGRTHNLGPANNFVDLITSAKGKYIAYIEGDDYWTDSLKLQKQVDFLEANPDFVICFHAVSSIDEDTKSVNTRFYNKEVSTIEDLCRYNYISSVSVVFKNNLIKEFPDWYLKSSLGDWQLHLFNAQHGKIKYFNDVMAMYRIHKGGIWSKRGEKGAIEAVIKNARIIMRHFKRKYRKYFCFGIEWHYLWLAELYGKEKSLKAYYYYLRFFLMKIRIKSMVLLGY
jgi:glycosyltransferase involved in cell wall biosynthesis